MRVTTKGQVTIPKRHCANCLGIRPGSEVIFGVERRQGHASCRKRRRGTHCRSRPSCPLSGSARASRGNGRSRCGDDRRVHGVDAGSLAMPGPRRHQCPDRRSRRVIADWLNMVAATQLERVARGRSVHGGQPDHLWRIARMLATRRSTRSTRCFRRMCSAARACPGTPPSRRHARSSPRIAAEAATRENGPAGLSDRRPCDDTRLSHC